MHCVEPAAGILMSEIQVKCDQSFCVKYTSTTLHFQVSTGEVYDIMCPIVVSTVGLNNTFEKLLPREVAQASRYPSLAKEMKIAYGGFTVFLGLDASNEELNLRANNMYYFPENNAACNSEGRNLMKPEIRCQILNRLRNNS